MKIKHSYQSLTYITYSIVGITILAGILLSCNIPIFPGISVNGSASATTLNRTASTTAAIRVKSTCSMTATIEPGEEHTATMINGQYRNDIGLTTIQTFCNDPNGYAIYAIGYTGGDTGVANGTNTVLHSNALGSTYDIVTGIATSGDISNWAMKVSSVSGTYAPTIESDIEGSFSDYHTVPQSYTKVAKFNTSTDATIGSSLTTTYAVYIKPTQPAGTYEGQVKYVLLHPASSLEPGTYYMQDVEDWGPLLAVGQEITAYDNRDNKSYTVRRMCMEGTGNTWQEKELDCSKSMLWMTQNLDLDLDSSVALNSINTDLNTVGNGAYVDGYSFDYDTGVIYYNPVRSTINNVNTENGSFSGWLNKSTLPYSFDPDSVDTTKSWYSTDIIYTANDVCHWNTNTQACNYLNRNNATATIYFSQTAFSSNGSHGKVGNYYNWTTAIASNASASLTESTYDNVYNNPQNSICPRGWRLPTISSVRTRDEFTELVSIYNNHVTSGFSGASDKLLQNPIYFVRSGNAEGGTVHNAGFYGGYLSSTVRSIDMVSYMFLSRPDFDTTAKTTSRANGWSIRCVSDY